MSIGQYLHYAIFGERRRAPRRRARRGPGRDWRYRAFVRRHVCECGCGRGPCHAAHAGGLADGKGTGQKAGDETVFPLFWECHFEFDNGLRSGKLFLEDHGINLPAVFRRLREEYEMERGFE